MKGAKDGSMSPGEPMKYCQTILLLALLWLLPLAVYGYGATGHARQQLRLIAADMIAETVSRSAMHVNLPELPLTLMDGESPLVRKQMDILAEEGLLQRDNLIGETREPGTGGWVLRTIAGTRYYRAPDKQDEAIVFGDAVLTRIGEVKLDPRVGGDTQAEVFFEWRAAHLREWVWAPAFNREPYLNRIKSSRQHPIKGKARLAWQESQWVLVSIQLALN